MKSYFDNIFFKQIFTHIGFFDNKNTVIWNELIPLKGSRITINAVSQREDIYNIILSYKIADKNAVLNKENRDILFLLNDKDEIYYINIYLYEKKLLFNDCGKGIELELYTENIAYKNKYQYAFVFKPNMIFYHNLKHSIHWDLLCNKSDERMSVFNNIEITEILLDFMSEKKFNLLKNIKQVNINNSEFKIKLRKKSQINKNIKYIIDF